MPELSGKKSNIKKEEEIFKSCGKTGMEIYTSYLNQMNKF